MLIDGRMIRGDEKKTYFGDVIVVLGMTLCSRWLLLAMMLIAFTEPGELLIEFDTWAFTRRRESNRMTLLDPG